MNFVPNVMYNIHIYIICIYLQSLHLIKAGYFWNCEQENLIQCFLLYQSGIYPNGSYRLSIGLYFRWLDSTRYLATYIYIYIIRLFRTTILPLALSRSFILMLTRLTPPQPLRVSCAGYGFVSLPNGLFCQAFPLFTQKQKYHTRDVCVCMYVCMFVWMDGWMHGCMHVCVNRDSLSFRYTTCEQNKQYSATCGVTRLQKHSVIKL